jgi:gliding motility-associated-like protein
VDYFIGYVPGTLSVVAVPPTLSIPNTFTPNGDGINDTWELKNVESFPNCTVDIYSRYGERLFSSVGYPVPWNGKHKGVPLPAGTYYYIIDTKQGNKVLSGSVTIIR